MSGCHFKIVVPAYNSSAWLEKGLGSLERQVFRDFEVCVIDDASTDVGQREIIERFCAKNAWKALFNEQNLGGLENIIRGLELLQPADDHVILPLDGDDWLYDEEVLEKLAAVYEDHGEDLMLTYGKEIHYPTGTILPMRELPSFVMEQNLFREHPWVFSSPKTFRYRLWKNLREEDLKDENHQYYRISWDVAFMLPLLEMAGERIKMMDDILYVYNRENPISDHALHLQKQQELERHIRNLPKYSRLEG